MEQYSAQNPYLAEDQVNTRHRSELARVIEDLRRHGAIPPQVLESLTFEYVPLFPSILSSGDRSRLDAAAQGQHLNLGAPTYLNLMEHSRLAAEMVQEVLGVPEQALANPALTR